jgi:Resolvase, N terminal domain/Helix-turn-helix domain of resolvase
MARGGRIERIVNPPIKVLFTAFNTAMPSLLPALKTCCRPSLNAKTGIIHPVSTLSGAAPLIQKELEHLGVGFVSLTEALDLTTPAGRAMAGLLAVFAQFEREILRDRVCAGLAHARQNGKRLGRPMTAGLHATEMRQLHRAGMPKAEIARRLQVGRTSVRRILGEGIDHEQPITGIPKNLDRLVHRDGRHPGELRAGRRPQLFDRRKTLHLSYGVGTRPSLRCGVPAFIEEIRRIFTGSEIRDYLNHLERTRFLAPPDPDLDIDVLDEIEDYPWPENPVMGAEELLRFLRARQLLLP